MPTPPDLSSLSDRALLTEYALRLRMSAPQPLAAPSEREVDTLPLLAPLYQPPPLVPDGAQPNPALQGVSLEALRAALRSRCERNVPGRGDSRKDLYDARVTDKQRACAQSVALIVERRFLREHSDGSYELVNQPLHEIYNPLCHDEPFRTQPAALSRRGTGFLFPDRQHLTSVHVLRYTEIDNPPELCAVFGFHTLASGHAVTRLPRANVFVVTRIHQQEPGLIDLTRLELNRPVELNGVAPLKASVERVRTDAPVYTIGHPLGLPAKVAGISTVAPSEHVHRFMADLDTYGRSSGSPVLHAETHEVVGIADRGAIDISPGNDADGCQRSVICPCYRLHRTQCVYIQYAQ